MADHKWKKLERDAAALFGGTRHWANAGERLDFESDTAVGQVKLVRVLSLEALTQLAEEMEREALPKGKAGVVCVKVRRGSGRKSPMLVVMTAAVYEAMNGKRAEQIAPAEWKSYSQSIVIPAGTPAEIVERIQREPGVVLHEMLPDGNEDPGYMAGPVLPNP